MAIGQEEVTIAPLSALSLARRRQIRGVLADIDDTITTDGRLTAAAYRAMESLQEAGLLVIPITGRPAGWCDMIARFWPVDGVVGENGAFYFRFDRKERRVLRRFQGNEAERRDNRLRLDRLCDEILEAVPGAAVASDQFCRLADLAIDYCEDVAPLDRRAVERIVELFERAGARAKVSSIHVNGWFGDYDKLAMTRLMLSDLFEVLPTAELDEFVFIGDSPNDEPMFAAFDHSVAVANVRPFLAQMQSRPRYLTSAAGGAGFAELAEALIGARGAGGVP